MRQLVRLLMMFGPMIFRQVQKYQRNKARKQEWATPDQQLPQDNRRRGRQERGEYIEHEPAKPTRKGPFMTEEEKNFRMTEDEFLLDKEEIEYLSDDAPETGGDPDLKLDEDFFDKA